MNRTLVQVNVSEDPIIYQKVPRAEIQRRLLHTKVSGVFRKGKYLWWEGSAPLCPIFHFGMTGWFYTPNRSPLTLNSTPKRPDVAWPPKFWKLHAWTDQGDEVVFANKRRLGRVHWASSPREEGPVSKLGWDALDELPGEEIFRKQIRRRRANVKSVLLNQKFSAGIGNWLADEILFESRLSPHRSTQSLSTAETDALRISISKVVGLAVDANAESAAFPKHWLFHRRWPGSEVTPDDTRQIAREEVAGRTTVWVPERQK